MHEGGAYTRMTGIEASKERKHFPDSYGHQVLGRHNSTKTIPEYVVRPTNYNESYGRVSPVRFKTEESPERENDYQE